MKYHEEIEDGIFIGCGFLEDGKRNGKWKFFYETGQLKNEIEYRDDVEHGPLKLFHENGNLAIECTYVNGEVDGLWKEYYENGQIQEVVEYINGESFILDFWEENGEHLLKDGTGKRIVKYGGLFDDVWEQFYNNKCFVSESKISGGTFISFTSKS